MYSPPSSKKKQLILQVAIYALMTATVLMVVFALVLYTLGYRFDRAAGTLEQGGLVQLNSIPSGAKLTINATRLSATTSTKTTLAPGPHTITMNRDGYGLWQKTVDVEKGSVLWLNYARLIPNDLPVEHVKDFPALTSSLPAPNRKMIAMTTEKTAAAVTIAVIDSDTPEFKTLTLPETSYTTPKKPSSQRFVLTAWNDSSRFLLLEHQFDGKSEWLVVDTENVARTKNISTIFDVAVTDIRFSKDDNVLYALMRGDVRKINIENETITAPLVRNVAEFSLYDESIVVYTTIVDKATKSRSVGYHQDGASASRTIRTFNDDGLIPLHITVDKYYGRTHVAIAYGNTVELLSGSLPRSDSNDSLSLTAVATMATAGKVDYLSSKTNGRFFIAQHGNSYSVYDLELEKATTTVLRGDGKQSTQLGWLDGYRVWSSLGGTLRMYEFDGANQRDIMPILAGQNPTITANNRYLYAPTKGDDGTIHLSRVRLILP